MQIGGFVGRFLEGGSQDDNRIQRLFEIDDHVVAETFDGRLIVMDIVSGGGLQQSSTTIEDLTQASDISVSFSGDTRSASAIQLDLLAGQSHSTSVHSPGSEYTTVLHNNGTSILAGYGVSGFAIIPQGSAGSLHGAADPHAENVTQIVNIARGSSEFIVVSSSSTDMLSVYEWTGQNTSLVSSLGTQDGLPFQEIVSLLAIDFGSGNQGFLAVDQGGALSAFALTETGEIELLDWVQDTGLTRLGNPQAADIALVNGRQIVAIAGADGGIALFQISPRGHIRHLESIVDTQALQLATVSDVQLREINGQLWLFAASEDTAGVAQFSIDTSQIGSTQFEKSGDLSGTSLDDILEGGDGDNLLQGAAGADVLIDGFGNDRLQGGIGEDVFVLVSDQQSDTILDYETGVDWLDLSGWAQFYDLSQAAYTVTSSGIELEYRQERLQIETATGGALALDDLRLVVDLDRPPISRADGLSADPIFQTSSSARVLEAASVTGQFVGLVGFDRVDYSGSGAGIVSNLAEQGLNQGAAAGDLYSSIEGITGSSFDDHLTGDAGSNYLSGNAGSDILEGGFGQDTLLGDLGDDHLLDPDGGVELNGGYGNDVVLVLSGSSTVVEADTTTTSSTTDSDDILLGGLGADDLAGGAGSDVLVGDFGALFFGSNDTLTGGTGNDLLEGGMGADTFVFRPGDGADTIARLGSELASFAPQAVDFQPGIDQIKLEGFTDIWNADDALSFFANNASGHAYFAHEATQITLFGIQTSSLTIDDFWV